MWDNGSTDTRRATVTDFTSAIPRVAHSGQYILAVELY